MPPWYLLLLTFLLGCATGGLLMALLRRRAIVQVQREFEQELERQLSARTLLMTHPGWSPFRHDA